ncbi:MAG: hypothetical protein H7122_17840 [Chitinophagaceae bacterium]|nr:hypothetical protein [Chitinophagaceae bacterium]
MSNTNISPAKIPSAVFNKKYGRFAGWNLQYSAGIIFAVCYDALQRGAYEPDNWIMLFLDALSAILIILAWNLAFKLNPAPPILSSKILSPLIDYTPRFRVYTGAGYNLVSQIGWYQQYKQTRYIR